MTQHTISVEQYKELTESIRMLRYGDDMVEGLYPYYTGRGMVGYGEPSRTCFGWTGDDVAPIQLELARLLIQQDWAEQGINWDEQSAEDLMHELRETLEDLGGPSTDSMGRSTIHYWRNITVAPGAPSEGDEGGYDD